MNEITIAINYDNDTPTISGRELHEALDIKTQYSKPHTLWTQAGRPFIYEFLKYEHITELTPEIMHELIEKIIVHAPDKSDGHRTQQIEINFRFDVAVATAIADSKEYDKKKKVA